MRTIVVALATAAIVAAANASQGAYFSQSWGWVALAFLVPTSLALILERTAIPGRLRIAFLGFTAALGVWVALSSVWSVSAPASIRETERTLVYIALALALALLLRRGDATGVLGGALVGITLVSAYGLGTRLFPDRLSSHEDPSLPYRLSEPLGYWNALGLLVAMGLLMGLGFVAHSRRARHAAAAGILLPVLATTLYFTFSRGAWLALGLGFAATVALDPRRLRLLWSTAAVLLASVASVVYASQQSALTTLGARNADAVAQGHRLALVVGVLALCSGVLAWGAARVARRVRVSQRVVRAVNAGVAALVAVAVCVGVVAAGGPNRGLSKLRERFESEPVSRADLNERLFSLSGNGRSELLDVAWNGTQEHPVVGQGAGSFEYVWYESRRTGLVVRDAHSLFAETLMELGAVGLALLTAALTAPAVASLLARRSRFVAAGAGAYLAWTAASALDWHWEMVGVSLTALLAGGAALLASDRRRPSRVPEGARWVALGLSAVLSVLAVVSLVGNQALFAGREAVARDEWTAAARHARRAESLLFWSHEPKIVLGDAAAGAGDRETALEAYRDAVALDSANWIAWLRLAQVAKGAERAAAYRRVRELNPLEQDLPGAPSG